MQYATPQKPRSHKTRQSQPNTSTPCTTQHNARNILPWFPNSNCRPPSAVRVDVGGAQRHVGGGVRSPAAHQHVVQSSGRRSSPARLGRRARAPAAPSSRPRHHAGEVVHGPDSVPPELFLQQKQSNSKSIV